MLAHPALRHCGLTGGDLRQRADAEAAAVLDHAQAIAVARVAREEAALRAMETLQLEHLRSESDPWHKVIDLRPLRGLSSPDLTLALTLHFAERDPQAPPLFGRQSEPDREGWHTAVEQARVGWGGLRSPDPISLPLTRPWSHRWATLLDSQPEVQLGVAHLVASLEPAGLWRFVSTRAYDDGLQTSQECLDEAREAFTRAAGVPFPLEAPPLTIEPAPQEGPVGALLSWLLDWLIWETRMGIPIELSTYLGAAMAGFDYPDSFDALAACGTLCHVMGVPSADSRLPFALRDKLKEPRLFLFEIHSRRARAVLRKLRSAQPLDARRDPSFALLGVPVLTDFAAADSALAP